MLYKYHSHQDTQIFHRIVHLINVQYNVIILLPEIKWIWYYRENFLWLRTIMLYWSRIKSINVFSNYFNPSIRSQNLPLKCNAKALFSTISKTNYHLCNVSVIYKISFGIITKRNCFSDYLLSQKILSTVFSLFMFFSLYFGESINYLTRKYSSSPWYIFD
jgi:hypothetical protein